MKPKDQLDRKAYGFYQVFSEFISCPGHECGFLNFPIVLLNAFVSHKKVFPQLFFLGCEWLTLSLTKIDAPGDCGV
jgi:hypothetical protein